jgi:hypothetical protein
MVPRTSTVLFVERIPNGPHTYTYAKNSGVRPLDLAYVYSQRISIWLIFSKGLRYCWVIIKRLGLC